MLNTRTFLMALWAVFLGGTYLIFALFGLTPFGYILFAVFLVWTGRYYYLYYQWCRYKQRAVQIEHAIAQIKGVDQPPVEE